MNTQYLLTHARLASMHGDDEANPLGVIEDAVVAIDSGRIAYAGPAQFLPREFAAWRATDVAGRWLTPGLIDCHTHLIYAGDRAHEWQRRLEGESYAKIAKEGGGIASTVRATRKASESELFDATSRRLASWLAEGVTTVEIKSGYGLSQADEIKMLRVARALGESLPLRVRTTFLGAHAIPPEFQGKGDAYLSLVLDSMLPAVAELGLADAVDVFCEHLAFNPVQTERLLVRAKSLGLPVKVHADQLSDSSGSLLAARFGALSAEHLEHTPQASVKAMGEAGVVAVLLPAAFYAMRESQLPPIAAMRECAVDMAIATDHNPGTSPCSSLLLVLNMACTLFRMTTTEALLGVTRHAAKALGLEQQIGQLSPGYAADIAIWDVGHVRELCYAFGGKPLAASIYAGRWVKTLDAERAL